MTLPEKREFRFAVNMHAPATRSDWVAKCRRAEELGFDVIGVADHLGMPAPMPALVLAAEATERVRLKTFVLNTAFYNPALLAREVATTDQFTGGRIELGLGAGYVKAEFETAGIEWQGAGRRVDHLEHTITELRRLFADPEHQPQPAQKRVPLMLAGRGDRLLKLGAEHADIIGFTGAAKGRDGEPPMLDNADGVLERVRYVRELLGARIEEVELNILIQSVVSSDATDELVSNFRQYRPEVTKEELLEHPAILAGAPGELAEKLRERREHFGFSYVTVLENDMEQLAPVIELLR